MKVEDNYKVGRKGVYFFEDRDDLDQFRYDPDTPPIYAPYPEKFPCFAVGTYDPDEPSELVFMYQYKEDIEDMNRLIGSADQGNHLSVHANANIVAIENKEILAILDVIGELISVTEVKIHIDTQFALGDFEKRIKQQMEECNNESTP